MNPMFSRENSPGTWVAIRIEQEIHKSEAWSMNVNLLARTNEWGFEHLFENVCPSSRTCMLRFVFWLIVNLGTIAPVMT